MTCPNCGAEVPRGAAACPSCSVAIITVGTPEKRKYTVTDLIEGIPFIAMGIVLALVYLVLFIPTINPALDVFKDLPAIGGLRGLIWVTETRFVHTVTVLTAFAHLMWCLAGLFLLLAGVVSLVSAKGINQASAAVTLMLFGLFAEVMVNFIQSGDSLEVLGQKMEMNATPMLVQVALVVVTLIMIYFKARARRKLKFRQAAEKAQRLKTAREQAAAISASAVQPTVVPQPPQNGPQP